MVKNIFNELNKSEVRLVKLHGKVSSDFQLACKLKNKLTIKIILIISVLLVTTLAPASYAFIKSSSYENQGDKLYKNQDYSRALEIYQKARSWWMFEKISPKLINKSIYEKIGKTKIMIKSTENFNLGKAAYNDGDFVNARQYLKNLAQNDPNNKEAAEILSMIDTKEKTQEVNDDNSTETVKKSISLPTKVLSPTPSYNKLHCPKLVKVEDNISQSTTDNMYNSFKKGNTNKISLKVQVEDPQNLPLYYRFYSLGLVNSDKNSVTIKDWSLENFVDVDVTNAIPGTNRYISVEVDNRDGYSCRGSIDLQFAVFYDITP